MDDIAGVGFDFAPFEEVKEAASQEQYEMLKNFMRKCNPEMTSSEILRAVWEDYETVGWGVIGVEPHRHQANKDDLPQNENFISVQLFLTIQLIFFVLRNTRLLKLMNVRNSIS